jgi:hypothetical protein
MIMAFFSYETLPGIMKEEPRSDNTDDGRKAGKLPGPEQYVTFRMTLGSVSGGWGTETLIINMQRVQPHV